MPQPYGDLVTHSRPRTAVLGSLCVIVLALASPAPAHAAADTATVNYRAPSASTAGYDGAVRSWLDEANLLRSFWSTPVPILTEDAALSAHLLDHVHYMDHDAGCNHLEDPTSQYYTDSGNYGGTHSVLWCGDVPGALAVDGWVKTPYHGEQVLDPSLNITGFADQGAHSGMDTLTHYGSVAFPSTIATWPSGSGAPVSFFGGSEIPSPVGHCDASYKARLDAGQNLGATLFASFPGGATPTATASALQDETTGTALSVCVLHADSSSAFPFMLDELLPREPLVAGHHYTASLTTGSGVASWDFTPVRPPAISYTLDLNDKTILSGLPTVTGLLVQGSDDGVDVDSSKVSFSIRRQGEASFSPVAATFTPDALHLTAPEGPFVLRVSFAGDTGHSPGVFDYALTGLPLTSSVSLTNPGPRTYGQSTTLVSRADIAIPDDSTIDAGAVRLELWRALPGASYTRIAAVSYNQNSTSNAIQRLLYWPVPGTRFKPRLVLGRTAREGVGFVAVTLHKISGWPSGSSLRAPRSYVDSRTVTISQRSSRFLLQWRPGGSGSFTNLRGYPTDSTGRAVVATSNRSGQFRIFVEPVGSYRSTYSGIFTQYRS